MELSYDGKLLALYCRIDNTIRSAMFEGYKGTLVMGLGYFGDTIKDKIQNTQRNARYPTD